MRSQRHLREIQGEDSAGDTDEERGDINPTPVTVIITAPLDAGNGPNGDTLCTATATHARDGDVAAGLTWVSDIDGVIGTGASFTTSGGPLTIETHVITATAAPASDGGTGLDAVTYTADA